MNARKLSARPILLTTILSAASLMSACAPLLVGGAMVGGALVVTDRRTSGAQLEDQAIEFKASNRLRETLGDRGRVSATSYNRMVLLTGEVPSDADKTAAEQAVARVDNVRSTVNELTVLGSGAFASSLANRSNDLIVSGKVKATFVDAKDLQANAFKVVTDRGVVYLMGRVTDREADRASELTRSINGVQKVVRVFEIITEAELASVRSTPEKK
jgi:osmotically-inducible protein OsmY